MPRIITKGNQDEFFALRPTLIEKGRFVNKTVAKYLSSERGAKLPDDTFIYLVDRTLDLDNPDILTTVRKKLLNDCSRGGDYRTDFHAPGLPYAAYKELYQADRRIFWNLMKEMRSLEDCFIIAPWHADFKIIKQMQAFLKRPLTVYNLQE